MRIAYMLGDAGCRTVTDASTPPCCERASTVRSSMLRYGGRPENLPAVNAPEHPAYVIYTSGSTGEPKGCIVTHRNVVRLLKNDVSVRFHARDTGSWRIPRPSISRFGKCPARCFRGAAASWPETVRDPAAFRELIRRHRRAQLNARGLCRFDRVERAAVDHDSEPPALRASAATGSRCRSPRLGAYPLDRVLPVNMYGITETTVHVTPGAARRSGRGRAEQVRSRAAADTACPCDAAMNLQPIGVPGEMYIGGGGVRRLPETGLNSPLRGSW